MTFRSKLFVNFILALLVSVALIAVGVTLISRQAFEHLNREHTIALVEQFKHEYERRMEEVQHRVKGIAEEQATTLMAVDLSRPNSDVSVYVNDAHRRPRNPTNWTFWISSATTARLFVGRIAGRASAYKMDWVTQSQDWASRGAFLMKMDTQAGPQLGLISYRPCAWATATFMWWAASGSITNFLSSLVLPEGTRALLYLNLEPEFQSANLPE